MPLVTSLFNSYIVSGARVRSSRQNPNSTKEERKSEAKDNKKEVIHSSCLDKEY